MGTYNIAMFFILVFFTGFLYLVGIFVSGVLTDTMNMMIGLGLLSDMTTGTFAAVFAIFILSPPFLLLILLLWAISGAGSEDN